MKKRLSIIICSLLIVALAWISYRHLGPGRLHIATPDEIGLTWRECALPEESYPDHLNWEQAEDCFGHPMPIERSEEESQNLATNIDNYGLQLTIGRDVYRAEVVEDNFPMQKHTLYKNSVPLKSLQGMSGSHPPNISLQNINDRVAWEFMTYKSISTGTDRVATIIYDGNDLRDIYDLDEAYRPYGLADGLVFVGKKGNEYFVVYDGTRVGPVFDEIIVAHCCEPVLYSVQYGQGRYLFWGTREGQPYVVEVSVQDAH
jgi:hypothetical protein